MENKLKIGQSFEVVEWLGCHVEYNPEYEKEEIGFQSIIESFTSKEVFFIYSSYSYIFASHSEVKPIGKLTITKLK